MSDADFIKSIQSQPEETLPRRIYADWLEENRDSRAEYLRVECEMATESLLEDRYWDLKERREELRPNIDPLWRDQLGYGDVYRPMFTRLPKSRMDRWRLMDRFIDFWHKPLTRDSGNTAAELAETEERLGCVLPPAVKEFYLIFGRSLKIWSCQDRWLNLSDITLIHDGQQLLFRHENQGVCRWAFSTTGTSSDPLVVCDENGEETAFSLFVLVALFLETMFSGAPLQYSDGIGAAIEVVRRKYAQAALPNQYWCLSPTFFEGDDLFVVHTADDFLWVPARDENAFDQLPDEVKYAIQVL